MLKLLKKNKNPYFSPFWNHFANVLGKQDCQFLDFTIIYHHSKNLKKKTVMSGYQEKLRTDGRKVMQQ